ncbi:MAG TPA: response regulator [Thermoanaerobaculia bacterium]
MILIVEDDPQVARLIALVLQRHGYVGEIVSDGRHALERVRKTRPQAIFADLTIRGMSGEALCATLKRDEEMKGIPFVVLSGDRDIEEKARSCGADDYLGKPFEFDRLIELVRKHADPNQ